MSRKPNYLIIGAMKSGTTILYDFICAHPDVSPAAKKEIHYFSLNYHRGDDWYAEHFEGAEESFVGEASPTYFDMASAGVIPKVIKRELPDVKLILIVRDPVERAISHYNHFCKINEIESLNELGAERFFNLPYSPLLRETEPIDRLLYQVLNFSCYLKKYDHYKSLFGENLLVLENEQLRGDPATEMAKTFEFLGLKPYEDPMFEQVRYSLGTSTDQVSAETKKKLEDFLQPDWVKFRAKAGLGDPIRDV